MCQTLLKKLKVQWLRLSLLGEFDISRKPVITYFFKKLSAITNHRCKIINAKRIFKKYNHFCYIYTFRIRNLVESLLGHSTSLNKVKVMY